jgi:F0F1-type ATP synthase alpha subunit
MMVVHLVYTCVSFVDAGSNLLGKVVDTSGEKAGFNTKPSELWEKEAVRVEVEKILDQQVSIVPTETTTLDTGIITMFDNLSTLTRGSSPDIQNLMVGRVSLNNQ